jgi:hypothetical protein
VSPALRRRGPEGRGGAASACAVISDWANDTDGFTVSEFDALLRRGQIVRDESIGELPRASQPTDGGSQAGGVDTRADDQLPDALTSLAAPRHDVNALISNADAGRSPGADLDRPGL